MAHLCDMTYMTLQWTIPVTRWSFWPTTAALAPEIDFIGPMVRRRLSTLSRAALKVANDCVADRPQVRIVFASRHGELRRTTDILRDISADSPVSPTSFSLSVLNAMTGIFGIARGDRTAASALSAGTETLGYALLEAHAQYATDTSKPVLLVYADEPADPAYGTIEEEVHGGALAILLDASAVGHLSCSRRIVPAAGGAQNRSDASSDTSFTSQSQAVHHCLGERTAARWRSECSAWEWSWHEIAA
jgi:Beta-ketoacyl synthase, N-terminal domain